jgi:RNA polymerase sigma-70 factor (sigma-E family)
MGSGLVSATPAESTGFSAAASAAPSASAASAQPAASAQTDTGPAASLKIPNWLGLRDLERETAVTALFDQHYPGLVRMAVLLGAGVDAEDVVAEAFCQLYRRWPRLRDPLAAPSYLRSVVCNLTRMRLRHLQVVRRHADQPSLTIGSAEQEVVLREDQSEVIAALQTLPNRQRQALVLRYWLDLKEAEVAASMGISCGAVKAHTSRGMAALTRILSERR